MAIPPRQKTGVRPSRVVHAWTPPEWELADVAAFQALARGAASAEQQVRALNWLLYKAAGVGDFPFRPGGLEAERETTLALGRLFVGQQVAKMMKLDLSKLKPREARADPHEDK